MTADLIIDFDNHLKHGNVWLVQLELPLQDAPDDVPSCIITHVYVVAKNYYQAQYIANSMYPDCIGMSIHQDPVSEFDYAARRNRSIL